MIKTVCNENMCNGCYACVDKCPYDAISIIDNIIAINAVIDEDKCKNCNLCKNVCPNINHVILKPVIQWKQGWVADELIRSNASSGGVASALLRFFIQNNGYVCAYSTKYNFLISNDINDVDKFSGSRYVKSIPNNIYKKINNLLSSGEKVLFIGLPCQSAAVQKFVSKNLKNLYTVDLICHGSPSPKMLNLFLKQYNESIDSVRNLKFRIKGNNYANQKLYSRLSILDPYTLSFINGLNYTENCYSCRYASKNRCSDITLGDSWGSELSSELKKGISLILCQSQKGIELLEATNIELHDVSISNAIRHNHQLREPVIKTNNRNIFIQNLQKNISYNKAVKNAIPFLYYKQKLKKLLLDFKLIQEDDNIHYQLSREKSK